MFYANQALKRSRRTLTRRGNRKLTRQRTLPVIIVLLVLVAPLLAAGPAQADVIIGTPNPDNLHGTVNQDEIWGRGGNDDLWGGGGKLTWNEMHGEGGNDWVYGEMTGDLHGEAGNDTVFNENAGLGKVYGNRGDDYLIAAWPGVGGVGDDILLGGLGHNVIAEGASGNDQIATFDNYDVDFVDGGDDYDICWVNSYDVVDRCEEVYVVDSAGLGAQQFAIADQAMERLTQMLLAGLRNGIGAGDSDARVEAKAKALFDAAGVPQLLEDDTVDGSP